MDTRAERRSVAVIRVEVRDRSAGGLLIELLEVGCEHGADRVFGRATDPVQAGGQLEQWLRVFVAGAGSSQHDRGDAETPS